MAVPFRGTLPIFGSKISPTAGVYAWYCLDTGRLYVGSSADVAGRMMKHRNFLLDQDGGLTTDVSGASGASQECGLPVETGANDVRGVEGLRTVVGGTTLKVPLRSNRRPRDTNMRLQEAFAAYTHHRFLFILLLHVEHSATDGLAPDLKRRLLSNLHFMEKRYLRHFPAAYTYNIYSTRKDTKDSR